MDGNWLRIFAATGLVTIIATSDPLQAQGRQTPPLILESIAGRDSVWGQIFRWLDPSEPPVKRRIEDLVAYVEGLQGPSTAPGELGARLFRTHCATCHGTNARGDGPMAEQLRRVPPDLTDYTARNGGVFPSERVHRIVDGRDVPSHGNPEMPVWGDVFSRSPDGLTDEAVKSRIEAIVRYLQGIQRRVA